MLNLHHVSCVIWKHTAHIKGVNCDYNLETSQGFGSEVEAGADIIDVCASTLSVDEEKRMMRICTIRCLNERRIVK